MIDKLLLNIQTYFLRRPRFSKWARAEDKKYDLIKAVEDSSFDFPEKVKGYLSTVLFFPVNYDKIYWKDLIGSFYRIHSVTSTIRKIPITSNQDTFKEDKDVWDYPGRLYYLWANVIASAYGWTEKQIATLDVDDALAFLQEILTDEQLDREFVWKTSEIAYPYDPQTKKSKFIPLERPYWMFKPRILPKAPPIPKSLLPMGNVVKIHDQTKKIKSISKIS